MSELKTGDYVLASRCEDGDVGDHWAVGFFRGMTRHDPPRYDVEHLDGTLLRGNGFRRAERIPPELGSRLLDHSKRGEIKGGDKFIWDIADHLMKLIPHPYDLIRHLSGRVYELRVREIGRNIHLMMSDGGSLKDHKLMDVYMAEAFVLGKAAMIEIERDLSFDRFVDECEAMHGFMG